MLKDAIPHFNELSSSQKLLLMEELWDELASEPSNIPIPEWHKAELERRYREYLANPNTGSTWSDVQQRLAKSLVAPK